MATDLHQPRATIYHRRVRASHVVVLLLSFLGSTAVGYMGYERFAPTKAPVAAPTTASVQRGNIAATINISGSTAAISQAKLAFDSTGRVTELLAKLGDSVKAGDALARLDSADLELQVAQAEVSLEQDKLKLDQLKQGPKDVEVAAAQAGYESAKTKYNDLKDSPKPEDVASAESAVRNAEVVLANVQDTLVLVQKGATVSKNVRDRENEHNYYDVQYGDTLARFQQGQASQLDVDQDWSNLLTAKEKLDSARAEAQMALRKAENDVTKAQDDLQASQDKLQQLLAGPTSDQLKSAEAAMLTAQSQLETKTAGASATDITAQEVAVRLAESALKQRQILLEKATLRAPIDGIVDAININVGEQVTASTAVMTIVNIQKFRVEARVDETDVVSLKAGQTATVTLDALPDVRLNARIASIAVTAVVQQGVVTYPVVLELEPSQTQVRPSMTASAVVEVSRRDGVLLVPNRAIRSQGRNRTVEVLVDGQPQTRTVTTGMSNDQSTEVMNGLQEGDQVIIPTTTTAAPRVSQGGVLGGVFGGAGSASGARTAPGR